MILTTWEPTFPTDNKELFFRITFLPLRPNLAPCIAFLSFSDIYYSGTIPPRSDMAHPSRKSPTLTLWKSLQIELSQQFPATLSWQNVFMAVQGSVVRMVLCVIPEFDRRANTYAHQHTHIYRHTHTHTKALSGEKQGANYGLLWQGTAVGKSASPQAGHSVPSTLPACPLTVIGILWCLSVGNKGTMETLKLLWRKCWRCFLCRHYNQIILNRAALCSLAHSLSLLRYKLDRVFSRGSQLSNYNLSTSL